MARHSGYRVKGMACELGCSCRWLELSCHRQFALTPHAWLARLREEQIRQLTRAGVPAKLISHLVGFADSASFCHSLKRSAGCTLRQLRGPNKNACSQKDNSISSPQSVRARQTSPVNRTHTTKGTRTM
jgi:AraC-like DNA-binding protein